MNRDQTYQRYCEWCHSINVTPAPSEIYFHEVSNLDGGSEGFRRFGANNPSLYKQRKSIRRGTWVTIGCLAELILGIRDVSMMEQRLARISLDSATKTHIADGKTFTLYEVANVMKRLGKVVEVEPEPESPAFAEPELQEFLASNRELDTLADPEPETMTA